MIKRLLSIFTIILFASCVPHKDLLYLQGEPVSKKTIQKMNDEPYRLQVNDIITIDIKASKPDLVSLFQKSVINNQTVDRDNSSGYTINEYGNIRLPYIGEMNVLGYTTKEVRLKFEESIRSYFKDIGDIFVTVSLAGIKYTVLGEIGSPGPKTTYDNKITIYEAISLSGDIPLTGNRKKVELWRKTAFGQKKYTIDLTKADAFESEIYYIQPNDIINVIPLKQKSWGVGTTGLASLTTFVSILTLITSTIIIARSL